MVMPVRQRCPKCGKSFMGSDCVGRPCSDCSLREARIMKNIPHKYEDPLGFLGCIYCGENEEAHGEANDD